VYAGRVQFDDDMGALATAVRTLAGAHPEIEANGAEAARRNKYAARPNAPPAFERG
jgi:outer membrane murein-binding lipoprotein Lpp